MKHFILLGSTLSCFFLLNSCSDQVNDTKHGAIVLGDTATIVTETDSQYLRDVVGDIEWAQPVAPKQQLPQSDTVRKAEKPVAETAASSPANGYKIDCGNYTITIVGIDAKEYKKQNPAGDNGLSYAITSGNIKKSKLVLSGAIKDIKVKQRYQSKLILEGSLGEVQLPDLGLFTAGWSTVSVGDKGGNKEVDIEVPARLQFTAINNSKLKNAADRSLRKSKASSKTIQSWLKAIRSVRNAGDEPTDVVLSNIQWQISGKDASGKSINKMLRLDVP